MKYVLMELQTSADGTVGNIVRSFDTRIEAEAAWHQVLAAAALSELPSHAAVVITSDGEVCESRVYHHGGGE